MSRSASSPHTEKAHQHITPWGRSGRAIISEWEQNKIRRPLTSVVQCASACVDDLVGLIISRNGYSNEDDICTELHTCVTLAQQTAVSWYSLALPVVRHCKAKSFENIGIWVCRFCKAGARGSSRGTRNVTGKLLTCCRASVHRLVFRFCLPHHNIGRNIMFRRCTWRTISFFLGLPRKCLKIPTACVVCTLYLHTWRGWCSWWRTLRSVA